MMNFNKGNELSSKINGFEERKAIVEFVHNDGQYPLYRLDNDSFINVANRTPAATICVLNNGTQFRMTRGGVTYLTRC